MIHFTGDVVTITDPEGTRVRQRCAWCGHLLTTEPADKGVVVTLPERCLVEVDAIKFDVLEYVAGQPMPPGACADRHANPEVVFVVTEDQPPFYSGPAEAGARAWVKANELQYGPLLVTAVETAREVERG